MVRNYEQVWPKEELERLQRVENAVWRQVLDTLSYVAVEALRGEVGFPTFVERNMRNKLKYINYTMNDEEKNIRIETKILERSMGENSSWIFKEVEIY